MIKKIIAAACVLLLLCGCSDNKPPVGGIGDIDAGNSGSPAHSSSSAGSSDPSGGGNIFFPGFNESSSSSTGKAPPVSYPDGIVVENGEFVMPDLIGKRLTDLETIYGNGRVMNIVSVEEYNSAPKGTVFDQSVSAGVKTKVGASVTVYVSRGDEKIAVPEVRYVYENEARSCLESYGFRVRVVEEETNEFTDGIVYSVDPPVGTRLSAGDTVTVYIAKNYAATTYIPFLYGTDVSDAIDTCDMRGLIVSVNYVDSDRPYNTVIWQSIAGGTEVEVGTQILLNVSNGTSSRVRVDVNYQFPAKAKGDYKLWFYIDGDLAETRLIDVGYTKNMNFTVYGEPGEEKLLSVVVVTTDCSAMYLYSEAYVFFDSYGGDYKEAYNDPSIFSQ